MKTKLFALLFAIVASTSILFAERVQVGDLCYELNTTDMTALVTYQSSSYSSNYSGITNISIPSNITYSNNRYTVTGIGDAAFKGCTSLSSVTLPDSVTSIGEYAFAYCRSLTSVTIPNSIVSIGGDAFYECTGLTSVYINDIAAWCNINFDNLTAGANPLLYAKHLFVNDVEITDLVIPDNVAIIRDYAFFGFQSLTSVTIPSSVTHIGMCAFGYCSGLTSIEIPNSVTSIGNGAFAGIFNIVYKGTASGSPWGAKYINLYVDGWLIYESDSKATIMKCSRDATGAMLIPNTVTTIRDSAFYDCSRLNSITIPNSVTSIGNQAFRGCSGLTSISIGNSITRIGNYVFWDCTSLTSVVWNAKRYANFTNASTPFYYKPTSGTSYDLRSRIKSFVIGDAVERIPAYLCQGMTNLTSIVIGSNVKSIGDYAFADINNRKVNRLALPANLETIGAYAFAGNTYLEEIDFGSNLAEIGEKAFDQCARVYTMTCLADMTPDVATDALTSISSNAELYVLKNCVQKYKSDANWNRFVIKEITTTETDAAGNTVVVEAGDNIATFTWPTNSSSTAYSLEITKDGERVCTLTFNSEGQLTGIAFAPSREGRAQSPAAILTSSGMQFTVTGLDYATNYGYNLTVKGSGSQVLASYSGSFSTTGASAPEGIDKVQGDKVQGRKVIRNGVLYIERGDKTYNAQGGLVK